MRYEGDIYRPPSEAYSYLLQVTVGCSHNKCTFCSMYKNKKFHIRQMEEVLEDLAMARAYYPRVDRIFLCDGDALCLSNNKLLVILNKIKELFPECERISSYARGSDINRKSEEELKELKEAGLDMVYVGAESGSNEVLRRICKGSTKEEILEAIQKAERCGIKTSVTFISGIGGQELTKEHAEETGKMIAEMGASYVAILTFMPRPGAPMCDAILNGDLVIPTAWEAVEEIKMILENTRGLKKTCVFRSNHASNYLNLKGNLPEDLDKLIAQCDYGLAHADMLKSEMLRAL